MKKFIPPYLFLICISLMIILNVIFGKTKIFFSQLSDILGYSLMTLGIVMIISVIRLMKKSKTELNTFKKPLKLLKKGLFQLSRNPIYLGFATFLMGLWIVLGDIVSVIGLLIFIIVANYWYIPYEEKNLKEEFKDDYIDYKRKVKRWI